MTFTGAEKTLILSADPGRVQIGMSLVGAEKTLFVLSDPGEIRMPVSGPVVVMWSEMDDVRDTARLIAWTSLAGLDAEADMPWVMPWGATGYADMAAWGPWSATDAADAANMLPWSATMMIDDTAGVPWGRVGILDPAALACWSAVARGDVGRMVPWAMVDDASLAAAICWAATAAINIDAELSWAELAMADAPAVLPWAATTALDVWAFTPFEREYVRQARRQHWQIPWIAAARIVMTNQNIGFSRVADGHVIRIITATVDIDVDSWCWRLRGTLPSRADADLVRPDPATGDPVEVELDINGDVWRFLVFAVKENYRFARGTYSISGYSPTFLLGDPGPRITETFGAQMAEQVVAGQLTGTPYSYIWDLPVFVWELPAGALWVQDATRIRIIQRIPEAIGGVVQTDPDGYTLRLQSRYPHSPKTWAEREPDATIMSGMLSLGTAPRPQPRYNEIIVSGRNHGVIAQVRREGTAGDNPAPHLSVMLLTNQAAVHERGRVELDATGYHRSDETLLLPLPGPGHHPPLLRPGMHVAVADPGDHGSTSWHGQVSGVAVEFEPARTRQQVTVERVYV